MSSHSDHRSPLPRRRFGDLFGQAGMRTPPPRESIILQLERLEQIESANNLIALVSPLAAAAIVASPSPTSADPEVFPSTALDDKRQTVAEAPNIPMLDQFFIGLDASKESSPDVFTSLATSQDASSATLLGEHFALSSSRPQEPFAVLGTQPPETPTEPPSEMKQPLASSQPGSNGTPANLAGAYTGGGGASVGGVSTPPAQGGGGGGGGGGGNTGVNQLVTMGIQGDFAGPSFAAAANASTTPAPTTSLSQPMFSSAPATSPTILEGHGSGRGTPSTGTSGIDFRSESAPSNGFGSGLRSDSASGHGFGSGFSSDFSSGSGTGSGTNQVPVANDSNYSVLHDQTLNGYVSAYDSDGDTLTYSATSSPSHGTLDFNSDGSFTYKPNAGYVGSDSFTFTASDGVSTSNTATVTLNVTNQVPVANDSNYSVVHDQKLNYGYVWAYDSDGDPLTYSASSTSHGTLDFDNSNGSFTYTPNAGYVGSDSFTYTASDGVSTSDPATVTIAVTNQVPVANDGSESVLHDQTLNGYVWAYDGDGDPLTYSPASGPSNGTLTLNSDGSFTYKPNVGYVGSDSFTYTASDGVSTSDPATVTIAVTNQVPVANNATESVVHNQTLNGSVWASDGDGDLLTYSAASRPSHGTLTVNSTTGSFTYKPTTGYVGSDSFTYTASDGVSTSNSATVTINVTNAVPVAYDGSESVQHDQELNGSVFATDSDGDPLTYSAASNPSHGTLKFNSSTGSFTYTPTAGYVGSDSFTYTASDGFSTSNTATVTITVTNAGVPVANDGNFSGPHDRALSGSVSAYDSDGDTLTYNQVSGPSHGTLDFNSSSGSFTYTPTADYVGSDSFTFTASDGASTSNTATVTLTVTNAVPVANDGSFSVQHDQKLNGSVSAYDSDGDLLSYSQASGPSNGALTLNSDGSFIYIPKAGYSGSDSFTFTASDGASTSDPATVTITVTNQVPVAYDDSVSTPHDQMVNGSVFATDGDGDPLTYSEASGPSSGTLDFHSDGSFSYTPNAGYSGSDSFTFTASDGASTSDPATVTITVTNQVPVANDGSFSVLHDQTLNDGSLSATDGDGDPLTYSVASNPSNGTLDFSGDGSFTYTPNAHYAGSDSFTFTVSDGASTSNIATGTIDVTNQVPVANDANYSTPQDKVLNESVSASDGDGDTLTYSQASGPGHGALFIRPDGSFSYTPNAGYVGSDQFTFTASDGVAVSNIATVTVTVGGGPPVANDDSYSVSPDSTLSVSAAGVLGNDTDPSNLTLSASLGSSTSNGTLQFNSDGSFTYTPNAHFTGSDSFTYTASDGQQTSNTATVTLSVTDSGTLTTLPDNYSVLHDQVLDVDSSTGVLVNDSDSDGDSLTATLATGPSNGELNFNEDGSFTYTPDAGYVGGDSFTYTASDGTVTSEPTLVNISVTDNAPVAVDQSYGIPENTSENVMAFAGLLDGATDADNDPLTAALVGSASHGEVSVNSDGSFSYTPATDYLGSDSFTYEVNDGALDSDIATVSLNVHTEDGGPSAGPAAYSGPHDQPISATIAEGLLNYASDDDNDPLSVSLVPASGPSHGTLALNPDGSFAYTPDAGYVGADSFQYTASDGALTSDPATVSLTITNATPVANADSYTVERNNEFDADASGGVLANDTDADGDTMSATLVSGPSNGTLTLNSDGSFSYTPNSDYTGSDSFTYTASDGMSASDPATVSLTVIASPPVANDDAYNVLTNNTLTIPASGVLGNDSDPDNMPITAAIASQPTNGTVNLNSDGSFSYTPNTDYTGTDSFTYTASDGTLSSTPATVTIGVTSNDLPPTAGDVGYSLDHDTSLSTDSSGGVLSGASDPDGDVLTAVLVAGPSNGTLQLNSDGSFTYTPNAKYFGTDSFTFQASDGTLLSNVATATLTVVNDIPTANDDTYGVLASGATTITADVGVLANDTDGENDPLTASIATQPAFGSVTLNSDGSFSYTPGTGFTGTDSFTYTASDGENTSTAATVNLTTAPIATDQSYSVIHDTPLTMDATDGLLTGASDADGDTLTAALASGPSNGTVTVNSDGSFTYTPYTHYVGTDSFTFTASDGMQTSAPATATIDVTNAIPQANPQTVGTAENTALTVSAAAGVLSSSSDADGDALTAQLASGPSNGALQFGSDGQFTYTPNTGFFGTDSFAYTATDGIATSAAATVTINVNQVITEPNHDFRAVATGDFNDDGNQDYVAADYGNNSVSVFFGNGDGTFQTLPSVIDVGSSPLAVVVGDFGNGQQDIAVANSADNTVTILMNNGSGSFTVSQMIAVGIKPDAIAAGDFLGDGVLDLAVTNNGSNTVSILQNNGSGTFSVISTVSVGSTPDAVAAGDLNGDGEDDLVVANAGSNNVSVLLSNGNGSFQTPINYAVGNNPDAVVVGNFNLDGQLDMAVANGASDTVSVLLNQGSGVFDHRTDYAVGSNPVALAEGNFSEIPGPQADGDGDADDEEVDLAVVNAGASDVSILSRMGMALEEDTTLATVSSPRQIALADFLNNGQKQGVVVAMAGPIAVPLLLAAAVPAVANSPATTAVATAADNSAALFAIGNDKGDVTVETSLGGYVYSTLPNQGKAITALALNSQDTRLAVQAGGASKPVTVWDISVDQPQNAKLVTTLTPANGVKKFAFVNGGAQLMTLDNNGVMQVWDPATGKQAFPLTGRQQQNANLLAVTTGGTIVATSGGNVPKGAIKGNDVAFWRPFEPNKKQSGSITNKQLRSTVASIAFSPNGMQIVVGLTNGIAQIWNVNRITPERGSSIEFKPTLAVTLRVAPIGSVIATFDRTGQFVVTGTVGVLKIFKNPPLDQKPKQIIVTKGDPITSIAVTSDNKYAVVSSARTSMEPIELGDAGVPPQ